MGQKQQAAIKSLMQVLDYTRNTGKMAINEAVRTASGGRFAGIEDLIESFKRDCEDYSGSQNNLNRRRAFLREFAGIVLDNDDTGAITGNDVNYANPVKTAESVVADTLRLTNGIEIAFPDYASYSSEQKAVCSYIKNNWVQNALNLIEESYGMSFWGSSVRKINFSFFYEPPDANGWTTQASTSTWINPKDQSLNIQINSYVYSHVTSSDGKSAAQPYQTYLDRVLAHELVHAVMTANIEYADKLPHFVHEGLAELVHGADDQRKQNILDLVRNDLLKEKGRDARDRAFTFSLEEYPKESYAGGYILWRYFAKQTENYSTLKWNSTWDASLKKITLNANFGKNESYPGWDFRRLMPVVNEVDATAVTSYIELWASDEKGSVIRAGKGGTWYNSGNQHDVFYGGDGKDVIVFASTDGVDDVYRFESGKDILYLYDGTPWGKTSVDGSDVTFWHGNEWRKGSITLHGIAGNGKKTLIQTQRNTVETYFFGRADQANTYEYEVGAHYIGAATSQDTLVVRQNGANLDSRSGRFSGIDLVDASRTTGGVTIARMRSILGGAGNDTLIATDSGGCVLRGGGGNDRLYLGKGVDRVYFGSGDGNDHIEGFEANKDRLVLYDNGRPEKVRAAKGELVLRDGRGTVTLKEGAGKKLLIEDGRGKVQRYWFGWDDRDNTYEYETDGHYIGSAQRKDTLLVRSAASINLREPNFRDIDVVDARTSSGSVRISGARFSYGGRGNDTISAAASSESILDGGAGSDTLTGSSGHDVFRFGMGYGKDRIVGSDKKDLLHLFDITDVNKLAVSAANGVLSLNIRGTDDTVSLSGWSANSLQTVRLANGREYHFARANNGRMTLV